MWTPDKRVLVVAAVALVPWTAGIATQVPSSATAHHWNLAWAGLDVAITVGLAVTAWLAGRRDWRAALTATATTTLMCADSWFDVCTSGGGAPLTVALVEAVLELTLAMVCLRVGLSTVDRRAASDPDDALPESFRDREPVA